ncbi:MAG: hypothetical protein DWH91_14115 [Planctomycetota bacterium]|nr:MAG: hypothetical protein DWH91_14115 [Planctomycetota bacterium]
MLRYRREPVLPIHLLIGNPDIQSDAWAKPQINMPLAGGLFTCQHCGAFITGERIKRKLKGGGGRLHDYYRCANNYPTDDHPSVRWRGDDLEDAIVADLETIRIPDGELAEWFNQTLQAAFKNTSEVQRQQRLTLKKRTTESRATTGTADRGTSYAR